MTIHEDQIERYGGSSGLRDLSKLESAIYRPQSTFGGEELYGTIFTKAAALVHSIVMNHPFRDGNKRTGMTSCITFLALNGYWLEVSQAQFVETALKITSKEWAVEEIAKWLQKNSTAQNI